MRFAHIADTHIRNLKYHKEYRAVFSEIFKKLRSQNVDYIVHCGDIAHTKTQISPEYVELCTYFLKNLADIAPTYVILGNHDGNLRNSSRQDAITPIVDAMKHKDLHLLKNSGEVSLNKDFSLNVLSVFDLENWQLPSNSKKINIALYHGSISGVKTDTGWTMSHGENHVSIFDQYDYGFLGDIHKTDQRLDKAGKIRYCGSTIQQNHGETNDKGYLLWDIESKEEFTCEHIAIPNPKPFVTVELTQKGRMPKGTEVPTGARLRLVSRNNLPLDRVKKAIDIAKVRFKPEAVTYLSRAAGERTNVEKITNSLVQEDLRDVNIQEKLIREYLKPYEPTENNLEHIFNLNRRLNTVIEEEEEVKRNINWSIRRFEWDNLFNYGESNFIDFTNMNGIVGILGKNFSGKSSIIDGVLYTIYNSTSKNNRKNFNVINQTKNSCRGYVEIDIGFKTYKIERTSKKYIKRLKGKETSEAKTDLDFSVYDSSTEEEISLNGLSRGDTDKNIRKIFGKIEDFMMTSLASQLGSLSYLTEGSARRKEILAKFLDLEIFERKFKIAKEEVAELKASIKRLEGRQFPEELKDARTLLARNEASLSLKERECKDLEKKIEDLQKKHVTTSSLIESIPAEIIDINDVTKQIKLKINSISSLKEKNKNYSEDIKEKRALLEKIETFTKDFPIDSVKKQKGEADKVQNKIENIDIELKQILSTFENQKNKIALLREVPCGPEFSHCKFIKDAYEAQKEKDSTEIEIEKMSIGKKTLRDRLNIIGPDVVDQRLEKYDQVLHKRNRTVNDVNSLDLRIERNKTSIIKLENSLSILENKKLEYENNKDAIENLENLLEEQASFAVEIKSLKKKYNICKDCIVDLYKQNGSLEQKLIQIQEEQEEFERVQNEFSAHDLFLRCMHTNGISYDIIKKRLPLINNEITKVLTNIVDFEILFENEENKLDILIKHPRFEPRSIEMGSGAEKTICAMAIRLALLNVSTLPKGDIFILDEPGTALDEDNMEGFIRILDMISTQFKTVLLISHLDSLKDIVDSEITIENKSGYACVTQ